MSFRTPYLESSLTSNILVYLSFSLFQGPFHAQDDLIEVEGFGQIVFGPVLHAGDGHAGLGQMAALVEDLMKRGLGQLDLERLELLAGRGTLESGTSARVSSSTLLLTSPGSSIPSGRGPSPIGF